MNNIEIGQRITSRRKELDLTLADVAMELGVAKSTILRYERGDFDKIKLPMIESIARAIKVNPEWLIGKSENKEIPVRYPGNITPVPKMNHIPILGTIACGEPILAEENIEGEVDLPEYIHADFALRCKGDSMINARIHDGDIVYIRQQPTVNNGEIAAVLIDDEATLKRVYIGINRDGVVDSMILQPANPRYQPMFFKGEELNDIRILGKAVGFTSSFE